MKKSKAKTNKSKLSLDDLKKKGTMNDESLDAISGGVLGAGTGATTTNTRSYDGDKKPPTA